MKSRDVASSIVLLLFSLLFWCQVLTLPIGQATLPDSGLWPVVLAVLISAASLIFFMKALKEKGGSVQKFFSRTGSWKQVALSVLILFAFASLFLRLGYLLSTFGLIAVFLREILNHEAGFFALLYDFLVLHGRVPYIAQPLHDVGRCFS